MQRSHTLQRLLSLITIFSLLLSPVSSAFPPPVAHAAASDPPSRVTLTNGLTLETATTFRTTVRLSHPQQLKQVIQTGATLLIVEGLRLGRLDLTAQTFGVSETPKVFPAADYPLVVTLLVTDKQLEAIARMQLMPERTDSVASLLRANHLLGSNDFSRQPTKVATTLALSAIASGIGVDSDGDGLTDTEEQWWCTDPNNQYTNGSPLTDGQQVQQIKDWVTNRRSSTPTYGPPFKGWPMVPSDPNYNPNCGDHLGSSVPDAVKLYVLGLNYSSPSTANDRYTDGQKVFGVDKTGVRIPNFVLAPGNHPFVAAFPVPQISVVPGSWHLNRVTTITTSQGQMTQAAKTYGSSVTRGTSDSIANTVTWNNWEEISQAVSQPLSSQSTYQTESPLSPASDTRQMIAGAQQVYGGLQGYFGACAKGAAAGAAIGGLVGTVVPVIGNISVGTLGGVIGTAIGCTGGAVANYYTLKDGFTTILDGWKKNDSSTSTYDKSKVTNMTTNPDGHKSVVVNNNIDTSGIVNSLTGVQYAINQQGALLGRELRGISYAISQPRLTETKTNGHSWGGAQTTTHTELEEHSLSESQSFATADQWSTAWAVDTAHAADLTFNYSVANNGTDVAHEITGLIFNIYLGSDANPIISYPAWQQFPNGTIQNLFPCPAANCSVTLASNNAPLTLDQMKRIDLGEHLSIVLSYFSYGSDQVIFQNATAA